MNLLFPAPVIADPEQPVQFLVPQIQLLDAEVDTLIRVVKARNSFKVTGQGLTVAVLDTGLRVTHKDFKDRIRAVHNFTDDNDGNVDDVSDGNGHGTNVTGIIAAGIGNHTGIAYEAGIVSLKVLCNNAPTPFTMTRDALKWVIEHQQHYNIAVVSLSLGDTTNRQTDELITEDPLLTEIKELIQELRDLRVPVVAAAGNAYFTAQAQGMGFPAILSEVISVGAVYDTNIGRPKPYRDGAQAYSTGANRLTPFSQRLHETANPRCYTDIFAPGAPITSSGNQSDSGESIQSGTSQATPVVSGVLLLMQEFYKRTKGELPTVDLLLTCLRNGSIAVVDGDDEDDNVLHTGETYRRIDAMNALDAIRRQLQLELFDTATAFTVD